MIDPERFIREREPGWRRLELLLERFETLPAWRIDHRSIQELLSLYRRTCSDLNQARSFTANPELLGRLNQLAGRGYRYIYSRRRGKALRGEVWRFFRHSVPEVYRREARWVLLALGLMLAGALVGAGAVVAERSNAEALVPGELHGGSPRARVEEIERGAERIGSTGHAALFSGFLVSHNIQVGFLAFSLGALTLVGGGLILFYNGVILGAVCAQYVLDGVSTFFIAWVGPHGALELPAIAFFGAAGLRVGWALHLPGDRTRGAALREAWFSAWTIVLSSALFLLLAGLIEGSFSQFSAKTVPYPLKIAVAVLLFALLVLYLFLIPSQRRGPHR